MSIPIIQLGQCGNQVGSCVFDILHRQGLTASPAHQALLESSFTTQRDKDIAKAFLIDMEPKVVNRCLGLNKPWRYDPKMSLVQEEGSGNNWAYGCNIHGPKQHEKLEQLFRGFWEQQDSVRALLQIQSAAGGTGSGLGTYVMQLLSDIFPKLPKFVVCVLPHLSGEVILQSYNATLSLATVYREADGVFIVQNDEVSDICTRLLKHKQSSLKEINQVIGRQLASVLFPVVNHTTDTVYSLEQNGFNFGSDMIEHVFCDSRFKLAGIRCAPHGLPESQAFNFDSWLAIQNDLIHGRRHRYKSRVAIYRGTDAPNSLLSPQQAQPSNLNVSFNDKHPFGHYNRSATMIENGAQFVPNLDKILERGYQMLAQNAYVYQYQKYGLKKEQMLECFAVLEGVQQSYKGIK